MRIRDIYKRKVRWYQFWRLPHRFYSDVFIVAGILLMSAVRAHAASEEYCMVYSNEFMQIIQLSNKIVEPLQDRPPFSDMAVDWLAQRSYNYCLNQDADPQLPPLPYRPQTFAAEPGTKPALAAPKSPENGLKSEAGTDTAPNAAEAASVARCKRLYRSYNPKTGLVKTRRGKVKHCP